MKKTLFTTYVLLLFSFIVFSYLFIDQNLQFLHDLYTGFNTSKRVLTGMLYITFLGLFFIHYGLFMNMYTKKMLDRKDIKFLIAATILLVFSYPAMLSYDIFNYIATAKVAYFYQENPYIIMPVEFIGDPLLLFTHAANKVALYGPGWILLTILPHTLGMNNFLLTMVSFKMMTTVFYIGTLWMLYKIAKSWAPVLVFGLNPLVIIETLASSHNDIVMIFFAISCIYLLQQKKILFAGIALFLSVTIKYATIFLLPVFIYIILRDRHGKSIQWEKVYIYCAIAMGIIFMISPLREEMYPWYASWFLVFLSLFYKRKYIVWFSTAFSFGLMLRYIPYMVLGSHFGITPVLRIILMVLPVVCVGIWIGLKEKIWQKNIFH